MLEAKTVDAPIIASRPSILKTSGRGPRPLADLIVDGLLTVTPELALRIIQAGKFDRQRPVRGKHVDALAAQMRNHEWTAGTQIHFGRTPDGELHLVNGQHRMHAVVKADTPIRFQILVTNVESQPALIRLYRRHDRLAAPRTITDALSAEGIPDRYEILHDMAKGCFHAALFIESGFRGVHHHADPYVSRSDEARLRLCEPWWPWVQQFQDAIQNAPTNKPPIKRLLMRSGAMAVALLTLRDQEPKADAFWRGTANDDGLRMDDPRKSYLRFLISEKTRSPLESAKAASLAWNAFYRSESLQLIRVYNTPIELAGVKMPKKR